MKKPTDVTDALNTLHSLLSAIAWDIDTYQETPSRFDSEYFDSVRDAALDAHLLVTYIADNLKKNP